MELCGWHSANWNRRASNAVKKGREPFDRFVLAPLFEAVRQSKTKLGICLGSDWNIIFKSRRSRLHNRFEGPIVNAPDQARRYSVFDIGENALILVSWKQAFRFEVPVPENWPVETDLIRTLRES